MQSEIEFHGTYRYTDPVALDRALIAAREQLDADQQADRDIDWMRCFIRKGSRLWVNARLSGAADPLLAVAVVETLARSAVEGVVEARSRDGVIDYFPCGE